MDGFEVPVGAVRAAARASGIAVPRTDAVREVGAALPGAAAGAAAAALAEAWRLRAAELAEALARHAAALHRAADGYEAADRAVAGAFAGER